MGRRALADGPFVAHPGGQSRFQAFSFVDGCSGTTDGA